MRQIKKMLRSMLRNERLTFRQRVFLRLDTEAAFRYAILKLDLIFRV